MFGLPECVPAPPVPIICHLAIPTISFQSWPLLLWLIQQLLSLFIRLLPSVYTTHLGSGTFSPSLKQTPDTLPPLCRSVPSSLTPGNLLPSTAGAVHLSLSSIFPRSRAVSSRSSLYCRSQHPYSSGWNESRSEAKVSPKMAGEFLNPCGGVQISCCSVLRTGSSHSKAKMACDTGARHMQKKSS